ncbi:MAG: tRNA (adenosine(37)-N6)-threonylcarbamoyltransferase complex dimerization subunit type 1 TsaB [Spirochaetales bacterium]
MKALAIDSCSKYISFAACNGENTAVISLDTGRHQSEKLMPAIDYVMNQCEMLPGELDFTTLCQGPGSFTGLRLAFAVLKAFELAHNCPLYAIPTLEAWAYPYISWKGAVIPVIDAKKNQFYASVYRSGKAQSEALDASVQDILRLIDPEEAILLVGPDAEYFLQQVKAERPVQETHIFAPYDKTCVLSLLELASKKFAKNEKSFEEYEGPVYIRKSEAEINLNLSKNMHDATPGHTKL